jgi:hypothetical protein
MRVRDLTQEAGRRERECVSIQPESASSFSEAGYVTVQDTGGNDKKDLHCTLLTNRATCFMQLKLYAECVEVGCLNHTSFSAYEWRI